MRMIGPLSEMNGFLKLVAAQAVPDGYQGAGNAVRAAPYCYFDIMRNNGASGTQIACFVHD
jgi:hypothetical protein